MNPFIRFSAALVVIASLALSPLSSGALDDATRADEAAASSTQEPTDEVQAQAPGGTPQGIQVHGHWLIEVHNPDGTLAAR